VAALRAAQTIKDLLTLGRQGRTAKENVDVNRVIKSCLANSKLRFVEDSSARVSMISDLAPAPLIIHGSESQLARAVDNLIRNAVEAFAGQGEVVVKSALVEVREPRVGSGLGLSIVHGVVKEHGGFIDVISTPGVGTTISLYFPVVDGAEAGEPVLEAPRGSARILIVDDEQIQLRTGRRVLVRLGYEVETMDSGLGAYELFARAAASGRSPFDLVIIDMVLGEVLDGLQVIDKIHRLFPAQKVIVVSGHAPTERAQLAVDKGLTWLVKPYSLETFAQTVQRVLRHARAA
jgi:CheY-like chemotaxis protein